MKMALKTQKIKKIDQLSPEEISDFADAFNADHYRIVTCIPDADNIPENLSPVMRQEENYKIIFEDENSMYRYFAVEFSPRLGTPIAIPIGVYGISASNQVRFPLVINGIWFALFSIDRAQFNIGLNMQQSEASDQYFIKYTRWKRSFMHKIFVYYFTSDYRSAMCWKMRNENSNTRKIAEAIGFDRVIFSGQELYCSHHLSDDKQLLEYLKYCFFRWANIGKDAHDIPLNIHPNTITLIAKILDYKG